VGVQGVAELLIRYYFEEWQEKGGVMFWSCVGLEAGPLDALPGRDFWGKDVHREDFAERRGYRYGIH